MKPQFTLTTLLIGVAGLGLLDAGLCRGEDAADSATKSRLEKFEKGPATIDVGQYPKAIQDDYKVFSQKCAQCHSLTRPINSDYVLPTEWSHYIKRMMYKPNANISGSDSKSLYDFLVYDSNVRKKEKLDAKLATLSAEDRKQAEAKIKEVMDKNK